MGDERSLHSMSTQSCECACPPSPCACTCSVHWVRRKGRTVGVGSNLCRGKRLRHTSKAGVGVGHRAEGILPQHLPGLAHQYNSPLTNTTYPHVQRSRLPDPGDCAAPPRSARAHLAMTPASEHTCKCWAMPSALPRLCGWVTDTRAS